MHIAHHEIGDGDGIAFHAELHGAFGFVGKTFVAQFVHALPVNLRPLGLEVGAMVSFAGAGRATLGGAFIPVEAEPAKPVENAGHHLLGRPLHVGVLDAQHERAALAPRQQPVEERGARAADVQVSRR